MDRAKGLDPERCAVTIVEDQKMTARRILENCMASGLSTDVAVARLAVKTDIHAQGLANIALDMLANAAHSRDWLEAIAALLSGNSDAFDNLRATAASVHHARLDDETCEMAVIRLAEGFDRAVAISPAASCQLSSLGDDEKLLTATAEIASWLERQAFTGAGKTILDIGCGIGRFELALHARTERIVGIDISSRMIAIARRRCAGLGNVEFRQTSGLDLATFGEAGFDCVLAVDSFPYLVLAGVAERHFSEIARVLRPGGLAAILNYSYRMSPAVDSSEVRHLARTYAMDVVVDGELPFNLWDGIAFLIRHTGGT